MLHAYTDGSSHGNPGPGGYGGVIFNQNNEIIHDFHFQEELITNNQAELKAILYIFKYMQQKENQNETCIIYSDSAYCVNICNDWIFNWARNNWKNSKKKIIENYELIKELYKYINIDFFNVQVKKCEGHMGIVGNELADALATGNIKKYDLIRKQNNLPYQITLNLDFYNKI